MGDLVTADASPNHRIYVDGRVLGQTPETVRVKCGSHVVKLGSSGREQTIDVPCGGEIAVK
jgi:hypothetical protein